jgi:hypothetical protein
MDLGGPFLLRCKCGTLAFRTVPIAGQCSVSNGFNWVRFDSDLGVVFSGRSGHALASWRHYAHLCGRGFGCEIVLGAIRVRNLLNGTAPRARRVRSACASWMNPFEPAGAGVPPDHQRGDTTSLPLPARMIEDMIPTGLAEGTRRT